MNTKLKLSFLSIIILAASCLVSCETVPLQAGLGEDSWYQKVGDIERAAEWDRNDNEW